MTRKVMPSTMVSSSRLTSQLALAHLRCAHRQRYRQAAADQDGGVDRPSADLSAPASGGKLVGIRPAINQVSAEHAAEEHDFRHQKQPHAQRGGIASAAPCRRSGAAVRGFRVACSSAIGLSLNGTPPRERDLCRSRRLPKSRSGVSSKLNVGAEKKSSIPGRPRPMDCRQRSFRIATTTADKPSATDIRPPGCVAPAVESTFST